MSTSKAAILPDHILSAVLALAEQTLLQKDSTKKRLAFRSHDFQLQEIFNQLRETGNYPILEAFVFSEGGPEPYSPTLNESVSRLQLSGLIGRENPDYEVVFLRPSASRFYKEVLISEFDEAQRQQLADIAVQFLEKANPV